MMTRLYFSCKKFWAEMTLYFTERLQERSTYIGIISLAASVGMSVTPEAAKLVVSLAAAVAGAVLIATADDKKPPRE